MVTFAEPLVSRVHELPSDCNCNHEKLRRSLYYSNEEIKQFKAEIRHMLKRRVFFDLKNSVVHNVSPIAIRGDQQQSRQLFYSPKELEQLEQDFVTSVKAEHGVETWSDDDKKPIALLVLERAKLREKYVASIRNKLVKLKISSSGPTCSNSVEEEVSSVSNCCPTVSRSPSLRGNTPKSCTVSRTSQISTTTTTVTSSSPRSNSARDTPSTGTSTRVKRITTRPRNINENITTSTQESVIRDSRKSKVSSSSSSRSSRGRGPQGLGLPRQGSGIAVASRRSSIEIAKRHAKRNESSMPTQHSRTSAMAA